MLRRLLLRAASSPGIEQLVSRAPVSRGIVQRYVAGAASADALAACRRLMAQGLLASVDRLGEAVTTPEQAASTASAYVALLGELAACGLSEFAEVSVKLSSLGQALGSGNGTADGRSNGDGNRIALEHMRAVCSAARRAGTTITLDMEDHTTTDDTLAVLRELRADFPDVGAVLQAYLRRTEADCRDLAGPGSRIRLCKGAYREPASVAYQDKADVDVSYVRCLRVLMHGQGYPMVATHDPRLVAIAGALALQGGRDKGQYEFQMLYGIRPQEQHRLATRGERVRVYVPYGTAWYPYLMRRLAERPANLAFFLRSLASRRS